MTININKNIQLNEMIKNVVESDIKKYFKVREIELERENGEEIPRPSQLGSVNSIQEEYQEVLLNEDASSRYNSEKKPEFMTFSRKDFDFIDLVSEEPGEAEGITIKVKYFLFRYKNKISFLRTKWIKDSKQKNPMPISNDTF